LFLLMKFVFAATSVVWKRNKLFFFRDLSWKSMNHSVCITYTMNNNHYHHRRQNFIILLMVFFVFVGCEFIST
jgi:hypothetical protein